MKSITVTFDNGKATIETSGFTGKDCLKATMALEAKLGTVTGDTLTAEGLRGATQAEVTRVRQ